MKVEFELEDNYVSSLESLREAEGFKYLTKSEYIRKLIIDLLCDVEADIQRGLEL